MTMTYSKRGLELTEKFEAESGPVLTAYADKLASGKPTVGWGHTGPDVVVGATWTRDMCEHALADDINWAAHVVRNLVLVSLTQGEFDSICDFVYNVGAGNFASSTMLKCLNESNFMMAALEFEKWSHAHGVVVAGLLRRRYAEEEEFKLTS